ncbi:type IV pili twitching motility protein PilT [Candidatus Falkowbacteria bacterium CG10_big_fil_rev_8_21_14_0_10_43_11]|uniref:Type IV pili twitching motility protein PilT n=1 Tax=Candidatus Falkowbacteria bacterium CG10_big_fil_rev_8_21_14_0_10_43_11 TaxID=1974568 RepID=A0A2M6WLJ6_9BACT|nr:MAG: type IV pili twitching motility protein PilT [Candidatus Falkowbacteria bacterium CG10_big_fil_rev_8_21_14_0_10_43_11]
MMNINNLFQIAVAKKASDIHLVVGLKPYLRVDGMLTILEQEPEVIRSEIEKQVFSLLNPSQMERLKTNLELDLSYETSDKKRFRINVHYEKGNLGLVARIILSDIPSMEELNIPKVAYDLLSLQQGLILMTGPTGCGKSTALAAMIEYINQNQKRNIITLEDPIEFLFKPKQSIVIQRELGSDMLSFKAGLKHIVRQDPDIIMVGEMRDLETIAATITLAETGHLVLATLHTYSAAQTIDRIIDIFPPYQQAQIKQQLASVLSAVFSQRLVPNIKGGRVAAREVLINTPAVSNLIRENKITQIPTVIETNGKIGMISMDKALKNLQKEGLISKENMDIYSTDAILD